MLSVWQGGKPQVVYGASPTRAQGLKVSPDMALPSDFHTDFKDKVRNSKTPPDIWELIYQTWLNTYEPRHDKTNKMSVHPAKTQISLGIRPI